MKATVYEQMYAYLADLPVISTHEHHLEDEDQARLSLEGIIENSYVGWQEIPVGENKREHAVFLEKARYNSYFVWLEKALSKIYDFAGRITSGFWEELSEQIKEEHRISGRLNKAPFHLDILKNFCRYRRGLTDIYWDPGSDLGHPEVFTPIVRSDVFIPCYHPDVRDHDGNSPWLFFPEIRGLAFDEYIQFILQFHREKIEAGGVGFKLATAYERTLDIQAPSYDRAAKVYMRPPDEVREEDKRVYGNYIIHQICALAAELQVPYQIHTGLGRLEGSNPMNLEPLIERFPDVRFVLFHGGYPWYHQIGALAHNHANVLVDMVWLPLISTSVAVQALNEYIEVVPTADRIAWGSDSWTSEEAYGALLAYQHVVATVLSEKVEQGYMTMEDAEQLAEKLMYKNARGIYALQ